jgi:hypothetical protein
MQKHFMIVFTQPGNVAEQKQENTCLRFHYPFL